MVSTRNSSTRKTHSAHGSVGSRLESISKSITKRTKTNQKTKKETRASISVKSVSQAANNRTIESIYDFKKVGNQTLYLIRRQGAPASEDTWEPEETVKGLDILSDFQQKVLNNTGYAIAEGSTLTVTSSACLDTLTTTGSEPVSAIIQTTSLRQKSARVSKTRAMLHLKVAESSINYADDGESGDSEGSENVNLFSRKRKNSGKSTGQKKGGSKSAKSPKALRGIAARKAAAEEQRKVKASERLSHFTQSDLEEKLAHDPTTMDCCLRCSITSVYKRAIDTNDMDAVEKAIADKENIPSLKMENIQHDGEGLVQYAINKGRLEIAKVLSEEAISNEVRVTVPEKYRQAQGNTGFVGRYTYGRGLRQVKESRGNRLGNTAFYRTHQCNDFEPDVRKFYFESKYRHLFPSAQNSLIPATTIALYENDYFWAGQGFRFIVSSGNRALAAEILKRHHHDGFNHLHSNVLQFTNDQDLEPYRRNQILKKCFEAGNITPLHCAAINPSSRYLKEFFEQLSPAECMAMDDCDRTVAHYAAASETPGCIEYLISKGFNLLTSDKFKITPLIQAARFGRHENVLAILKSMSNDSLPSTAFANHTLIRNRWSPLHYAAYFGHAKTCQVLIDAGATLDAPESTTRGTPLHYAARRGHLECVKVFIEYGKMDPDVRDRYERTPLHLACDGGYYDVVKYLLDQGVDADCADSSHNRPIHYAAAFGEMKILKLLIHYGGSDPSVANIWRKTPCSVADSNGHMAVVHYLLTTCNINVDFKDEQSETMLHVCAREKAENEHDVNQLLRKANLLMSKRANPNLQTIDGDAPLHFLAASTYFTQRRPTGYKLKRYTYDKEVIAFDEEQGLQYQVALAKILIDNGADIHIKNANGQTPFALAMSNKNYELASLLIQHGANIWTDTNGDGSNVFHLILLSAAHIDSLPTHSDVKIQIRDRFIKALAVVWDLVCTKQPPKDASSAAVNATNHQGYTPILSGTHVAVSAQRLKVMENKRNIKNIFQRKSNEYSSAGSLTSGEKAVANFEFNFNCWFDYAKKIIARFTPDMNATVQLPKDFFKENPKRPVSEYPEQTGYNALHIAATTQHYELLKFLLENGVNPNHSAKRGTMLIGTPLSIGFFKKTFSHADYIPNCTPQRIEHANTIFDIRMPDFTTLLPRSTNLYLQFGGNPCIPNEKGVTPLMNAASNLYGDILQDMCNHIKAMDEKPDINIRNEDGFTALMFAIDGISIPRHLTGDNPVDLTPVSILIEAGADINMQYPKDGDTVLMKAIRKNYPPLVKVILEKSVFISHGIANDKLETPAILVCKNNDSAISEYYFERLGQIDREPEKVNFDINSADFWGNSALILASQKGNEFAVKQLLALGADPNKADDSKQLTPLLVAVKNCHYNISKQLLEAGADVTFSDSNGKTALHHAVEVEKYSLVKLLLDFNADACARTNTFCTPLHLAIQQTKHMTNVSLRVERLLLQAGADINAKDIFGRTPLHISFVHLDYIPNIRRMTTVAKKVKQMIAEKSEAEKINETILQKLESMGNRNYASDMWMKKGLLEHFREEGKKNKSDTKVGQDNVLSRQEKEALKIFMNVTWEESSTPIKKSDPIDIVDFLSNFNHDLQYDVQDAFGRTPLHYAACVGAFSCTSHFADKNVYLDTKDEDGNTPLQLALRYHHVDYAVMLCDKGASTNNVVTLPNGQSMSTFHYSLSQSFMNMAYLIMKSGISILESIRDALATGKFHLAEILFHTSGDSTLSGFIQPESQNLWHFMSMFKPFNAEIWNEYLPDFIDRMESLKILAVADSHQRTPVHYAAKYGQVNLLRHLVTKKLCQINLLDEDGVSELWYAVSSNQIECVQILLDAGAKVNLDTNTTNDSMLLTAVTMGNRALAELLIDYHVELDNDSKYGRPNAVMKSILNNDFQILNLLVNRGANINTPSTAKDWGNQKQTFDTYPIFLANDESFKLLVTSGANTSVFGPMIKPWEGKSCFMYNISNIERTKILIDNGADVNEQDENTKRTIFYHFLFQTKDMTLPAETFQYMLQKASPNVNILDIKSGMVPLEAAIRKHDPLLTEFLLKNGANPNIESSKHQAEDEFYYGKVNAIFHAVAQNDLVILQLICNRSIHPIQWNATDEKGRSIVSFAVQTFGPYSFENTEILKYLATKMGKDNWLQACEIPDNDGIKPSEYAVMRNRQELYNTLLELDVEPVTKKPDSSVDTEMQFDYIASQVVEEDSEAQRSILEAEAAAKDAELGIEHDKEKSEEHQIDKYSKLETIGELVVDESGDPYDIMVQKIDVTKGYYGSNLFYKMSIIYNKVVEVYVLWTRWGGYGEVGMHQKTPFLTKEEAVAEFKSIFKAKTGNEWSDRKENFVPKPRKYELIIAKPPRKHIILKNTEILNIAKPSSLSTALFETLHLFCNLEVLSKGYKHFEMDVPVGQVPQSSINKAYEILGKLKVALREYHRLLSTRGDNSAARSAEKNMHAYNIGQYSNQYFRLLPRTSHNTKGIRPLISQNLLEDEMGRLNDVSHITFTLNVILAAKYRAAEIHPYDYCYRALNCNLNEIDRQTSEFNMIARYMNSTSNSSNYEIAHLFAVDRIPERERFAEHAQNTNRKLLWHGSNMGHFMGILKHGLRCKPSVAENNGSMFGNGIYFADMFSKSINYATSSYGHPIKGYALLVLCEVALGEECEMEYYNESLFKPPFMSIKARGKSGPNPANAIYDQNGVQIPLGPPMTYPQESRTSFASWRTLAHNEYIVYNESQVKIRYLVVVRDKNFCTLCGETSKTVYRMKDYKLLPHNFTYPKLNEYEAWLIRIYLKHKKLSPKDVFDAGLDEFISKREYMERWKPIVPMTHESKVCMTCAHISAVMILVKRVLADKNGLPNAIQKRAVCPNGTDCPNAKDIVHAKKFQHWLNKKKEKAAETEDQDETMDSKDMDEDSDDESYDSAEDSDVSAAEDCSDVEME